jgi:hypothetical protein
LNFPILQLQELHRSRVFPDADHPSKALNNVFTEKRQGGIFAGFYMPVCRLVGLKLIFVVVCRAMSLLRLSHRELVVEGR